LISLRKEAGCEEKVAPCGLTLLILLSQEMLYCRNFNGYEFAKRPTSSVIASKRSLRDNPAFCHYRINSFLMSLQADEIGTA
jgi:hypothetical protein